MRRKPPSTVPERTSRGVFMFESCGISMYDVLDHAQPQHGSGKRQSLKRGVLVKHDLSTVTVGTMAPFNDPYIPILACFRQLHSSFMAWRTMWERGSG